MSVQQVDTMPPNSPQEAVYVLGVRVDLVSQQQALHRIEQMIVQHKSSASPLPCQQIITVNPEFVMAAQRLQEFRIAINSAALVVADGTGVVWATRYLGLPTPERLTGTDQIRFIKLEGDKLTIKTPPIQNPFTGLGSITGVLVWEREK